MEEAYVDEFLLKLDEVLAADVLGGRRETDLLCDGCEVVHHHLLEEMQSLVLLFVVLEFSLQPIHFISFFHFFLL